MNIIRRLLFRSLSVLPLALGYLGCAQTVPPDKPKVSNEAFDQKIANMISFSVPLMSVEELHNNPRKVYIFDAREFAEYQVSHIPNARYLGFDKFDPQRLTDVPRDAKIVLYCSIGYRSEKIGEKLQSLGYAHVFNLYGSIFEWANQGYPLVDAQGKPTRRLHTYNKNWSQWVDAKKADKVW